MHKIILLTAFTLWSLFGYANTDITPRPLSVEPGKGHFTLSPQTRIVAAGELKRPAELFAAQIARILGSAPVVSETVRTKSIVLKLDPSLDSEAYRLTVGKQGIEICGGTPQGIFHGLQSLRQLIVLNGTEIPAVVVHDKPSIAYRGGMFDTARHSFTVEDVKGYIDLLSMHKLNRFHWHLTDDQGWRIEIKRYPLLTEIGSKRKQTLVGRNKPDEGPYDGIPCGGYFTQDDIREVIAYAAERYIEVIPEIEMPGHALGALTAYPELGCTQGPYDVWMRWGVSEDVFCAGRERTFEFMQNVLSEVLALFPSKYIHIGGDECPKARWKACPDCQARIREEGLKNEDELQSYFIHRIEGWLHEHGRELIGWDEIMQGGISKTAVIMVWRDQKYGIDATHKGNKVIMAPKWNCYLDYSQTSDPEHLEPVCNPRYLAIRQVYRLDPYDQLKPSEWSNVLGVQANLWSEYIKTFRHAQHMLLPRMAAIAEVGWSCDRKDYNDFTRRLWSLKRLYDVEGYNYSPYFFEGVE